MRPRSVAQPRWQGDTSQPLCHDVRFALPEPRQLTDIRPFTSTVPTSLTGTSAQPWHRAQATFVTA